MVVQSARITPENISGSIPGIVATRLSPKPERNPANRVWVIENFESAIRTSHERFSPITHSFKEFSSFDSIAPFWRIRSKSCLLQSKSKKPDGKHFLQTSIGGSQPGRPGDS